MNKYITLYLLICYGKKLNLNKPFPLTQIKKIILAHLLPKEEENFEYSNEILTN